MPALLHKQPPHLCSSSGSRRAQALSPEGSSRSARAATFSLALPTAKRCQADLRLRMSRRRGWKDRYARCSVGLHDRRQPSAWYPTSSVRGRAVSCWLACTLIVFCKALGL